MLRKELRGGWGNGGAMTTETSLETLGASATNGGREASIGAEPKATVLAHDDVLSGRLQINGSGQILGRFSGQVECDGDLFIGPEAHVEADIKSSKVTVAGLVRGTSSRRPGSRSRTPDGSRVTRGWGRSWFWKVAFTWG
jgi:hypothetical protein